MADILVISGHPDLSQSHTNRLILDRLQQALPDLQIRALDRLYPDYRIDVASEQAALRAAKVIVLQFPLYWYSVPALLKKWIDDVFTFNFAYGPDGDKLRGKALQLSFTVGGPAEAYTPLGYNHFPIAQLLQPLQQTAYLAGMSWQEPVYQHGMVYIPGIYNTLEQVQARAEQQADVLLQRLQQLTAA